MDRREQEDDMLYVNVICNDIASLRRMAAIGIDINRKLSMGIYCLHAAAHYEMAKFLLDQGADPNSGGELPCKDFPTLDCVLLKYHRKHPTNCNKTSYCTPLHISIRENDLPIAKLLLERGANVNTPDSNGQSPLLMACYSKSIPMIKTLINAGAHLDTYDKRECNPLKYAITTDKMRIFDVLLDNGADLYSSYPDLTPLHEAASLGRVEMAKKLIEKSVPVDIRSMSGKTPLIAAVADAEKEPSVEMVKMLIEKGAKVNAVDGRKATVALYAAQRGNLEIMKIIKEHDPSVLDQAAENNQTPLLAAVLNKNEDIVMLLLNSGVNVNCPTDDGKMPIHLAILRFEINRDRTSDTILRELLERGAYFDDDTICSLPNRPPAIRKLRHFFHLVKHNDDAGVSQSIDSGVITNGRDKDGKSALHHAVEQNNKAIVRQLLRSKINVMFTTIQDKQTALHYAIKPDATGVVLLILEYAEMYLSRADLKKFVNIRRSDGKTALQLAKEKKLKRMVEALIQNGAEDDFNGVGSDAPVRQIDPHTCRLDCNLSANNEYGRLCWTLDVEYYAVAQRLFSKFAKVELAESNGTKLVHVIRSSECKQQDVELIEQFMELISMGLLIGAKTKAQGNTLLHLAPDEGFAKALLSHGAFFEEKNNQGKMPIEVNENTDIKTLIEDIKAAFANPQDKSIIERAPWSLYRAITHARNRLGKRCRHDEEVQAVSEIIL